MSLKTYLNFIKKKTLILIIIFLFITIGTGAMAASGSDNIFSELVDSLSRVVDDLIIEGNLGNPAIYYIMRNGQVILIAFIAGSIPFLFLPFFIMALNGMYLGVGVPLLSQIGDKSLLELLIKGVLPHGIIEMVGIIIAVSAGFNLTVIMTRKILNREVEMSVNEAFIMGLRTVIFVSFPMILVAAFIEAYITPILL